MKYLRIPLADDMEQSTLPPEQDEFQDIESGDLVVIRWNEVTKGFEHFVCTGTEGEGEDGEEDMDWDTGWVEC